MPKCYSYIRFSRPEQMRGDSLRRQTEAAEKWAAEHGMVIEESLTDLGVSAYRGLNRIKGALGGFLALVEKGNVPRGSYLIIESLDRFSRQGVLEVLPRFIDLLQAGIIVVTLIDRQVYSAQRIEAEPMALFGSLMVIVRAHEESRTKAERVGQAWDRKRKEAEDKVLTARVPGWLRVVGEGIDRRIEFKPAEDGQPSGRDIIRRIFAETLGGYGKRRVAARLNDDGIQTLEGGKAWHPSYIQKVLQNRAVLGEMQSYKRDREGRRVPAGPPVKGYYPAAVGEGDFIRANATKLTRVDAAGPADEKGVVNVFRGLAFCSCGGRMMRINKGPAPKGAAYLTCAEASRGDCTNGRRWRIDWAEERLLQSTVRLDLAKVLATADAETGDQLSVGDLEAKVAALTVARANIMKAVEAGVDAYLQRSVDLTAEINAANAELAEARRLAAAGAREPSVERRRVMLLDLQSKLKTADPGDFADLRTRLAQEIRGTVSKVVFGPDRITATYKGFRLYAGVWIAAEMPVTLFTDNPEDLSDMAEMMLDPDELLRQDRLMAEFLRRARIRREALPDAQSPIPEEASALMM